MAKGIIFDINEFAVYDGPGIRTAVFFKGCNLRCRWCHNPEGFKFEKELIAVSKGPAKTAGVEYEAKELAQKLLKNADYLKKNNGGYTISGGEPAAQEEFLLELLELLRGNHRAVETSGYCSKDTFISIAKETELILFDLKLIDKDEHFYWTGGGNNDILLNLDYLKYSGNAFIIRIPVIPGVNDNMFEDAANLLEGSKNLLRVELLPYHKTAGAKYSMVGLNYEPLFDTSAKPFLDAAPFTNRNISCMVF